MNFLHNLYIIVYCVLGMWLWMFWRSILDLSSHAARRWRQYVLMETSIPNNQITQSHNLEDNNFES
jgi:hypothetical protein